MSTEGHAFVSYHSQDRDKARRVRQALVTASHHEVWWDGKLEAGREWTPDLEKALESARCVVVLWSQGAVTSPWVIHEASIAAHRGVLVPAFLERCELPAPFVKWSTVDLTSWNGDEEDGSFRRLVKGVEDCFRREPAQRSRSGSVDLAWHEPPPRALGIGLIGADGTGKTTLVSELKKHYAPEHLRYISEVSRNVIEQGYPLGKNAHPESYVVLMRDQIRETLSLVNNHANFISDRTLLDQLCYSQVNKTLPRPMVNDTLISLMEQVWLLERDYYKRYLYFPIEFDIVADGVREVDVAYQRKIGREFERLINVNEIPFDRLSGPLEERVLAARATIDKAFFRGSYERWLEERPS